MVNCEFIFIPIIGGREIARKIYRSIIDEYFKNLEDDNFRALFEYSRIMVFLVVGDEAADMLEEIKEYIRNKGVEMLKTPILDVLLDLKKIRVETISERRLSDFTLSLFFNLLKLTAYKPDIKLAEELIKKSKQLDRVQRRKLHYFLPKLRETIIKYRESFKKEYERKIDNELLNIASSSHKVFKETFKKIAQGVYMRAKPKRTVDYSILAISYIEAKNETSNVIGSIISNGIQEWTKGYAEMLRYVRTKRGFKNDFNQLSERINQILRAPKMGSLLGYVSIKDVNEVYNETKDTYIELLLLKQEFDEIRGPLRALLKALVIWSWIRKSSREIEEKFDENVNRLEELLSDLRDLLNRKNSLERKLENYEIPINIRSNLLSNLNKFSRFLNDISRINNITLKFFLSYSGDERGNSVIDAICEDLQREENEIREIIDQVDSIVEAIENALGEIDQEKEKCLEILRELNKYKFLADVVDEQTIKEVTSNSKVTFKEKVKREISSIIHGTLEITCPLSDEEKAEIESEIDEIQEIIREVKTEILQSIREEWTSLLSNINESAKEILRHIEQIGALLSKIDDLILGGVA